VTVDEITGIAIRSKAVKTKRFVTLPVLLTIISLLILVPNTTNVVRAKNRSPGYHLEDVSYETIAEMISRRHDMKANNHSRPPLVLVHGWRGLDENAPCLTDAPDPSDYPPDYWLHVDEDLVERGFDVTFAKLITGYGLDGSTPGCSPLAEDNVPHLMIAIDNALTANPGQDKVILIAHSMGGLVSRAYLESANYRGDVVELYTLGTPHLGVPITGIVNLIEFLTTGSVNLRDFCTSQPVACQFSDDEALVNGEGFTGIATFKAIHNQRREGVHYHLVGGDVDFGDRSTLGAIMDAIVSGPDDGIVPRDSATGINSVNNNLGPLAGSYDRRETYELHSEGFADSANWPFSQRKFTYFAQDEYDGTFPTGETFAKKLLSETFMECLEPVISSRQPDHVCNSGTIFPADATTPDPGLNAIAPSTFGTLTTGQAITRSIWFEGSGGAMLFARLEEDSALDFSLLAPDGTIVNRNRADTDPNILAKIGENAALFLILEAQAGEWQLVVEAINTPPDGARYITGAVYESSVEETIHIDRGLYRPGESGTLTVNLANVSGATIVNATIGDGASAQTITLTGNGGLYTGDFPVPNEPGYQGLSVKMSGTTSNGTPFEQERRNIFPVASNTFSLRGISSDSIQPASNSKAHTPDLVMVVEVEALVPGKVGVSADLLDRQGNVIATSNSIGSVNVGDNSLELRFQGRDIFNAKRSGPYTLTNVRLIDYDVGGIVIETTGKVYTTGAYDVSDFAASPTSLPHEIDPASPDISLQSHDSAHVCQVTASNNTGSNLAVADTFQVDCQIDLDSDGKYPEWMSYYYTIGPNDWSMSNQSNAPDNIGGWADVEPVTQILNNATGLAYWGLEYPNSSDLDLANRVLPDPGTFWGPWRPDTGTPHNFSLTFAVPASRPRCPGSPFVGLSMDQSQNVTVTGVSVGDLIDHSINQTTVTFGGYVCPPPSVKLSATVGPDDTCTSSTTVTVPEDHQDVTFCYTLTNNSLHVTVIDHTLTDTLALNDPTTQTLLLGPGVSHTITASTTLSGTQGNCYNNEAEWRAVTATGFGQSQGNDANTPFMETTYQAVSHAKATVCVGTVSIYLPFIVKKTN
jgi:pimeloyl-ACP methyl ester carboxylesterase